MAQWKAATVQSPICGKTHGDTFQAYGDIELLKMQFADQKLPQIRAIEIYHDGKLVFGYEIFYQDNIQVGHHIGCHIHSEV